MSVFDLSPLPRSLEASLRDARHAKAEVRASAVQDLARHAGHAATEDGRRAADELVQAVTGDVSAQVRGAAALALADAKVAWASGALLDALSDSHLHVRQMALIALGELGDPGDERLAPALDAALADEAPALRFQALIALSRVHPERAEARLVQGVGDVDPEVRHVSVRLLEESALGAGSPPSAAVLGACKTALADPSPAVRLVAALLLGRAGKPEGSRVIEEALNGRASLDPEDEHAAIAVVGELGIEGALPGLRRRAFALFGRHRFAHEALIALARMGDSRARRSILRDLDARRRDTRTLAVIAAGRAGLVEARATLAAMTGNEARVESAALAEALASLDRARVRS